LDFDSCSCQPGYAGSNCENVTCSGIVSTNPTVCSGHGSCHSLDVCTCNGVYYGQQCQHSPQNSPQPSNSQTNSAISCYGISSLSATVCSGNGNCTFTDSCSCLNGFSGNTCQNTIITCFGINAGHSNVCSGIGHCHSIDTCHDGFSGSACEINEQGNIQQQSNANGQSGKNDNLLYLLFLLFIIPIVAIAVIVPIIVFFKMRGTNTSLVLQRKWEMSNRRVFTIQLIKDYNRVRKCFHCSSHGGIVYN